MNPAGTEVSSIAAYPVTISSLDLEEDTVTITNTSSQKVALKGWKIESVTGDQVRVVTAAESRPKHWYGAGVTPASLLLCGLWSGVRVC